MRLLNPLLIIDFGEGTIDLGFPYVQSSLYRPGSDRPPEKPAPVNLPANPQLATQLRVWQTGYPMVVRLDGERHQRELEMDAELRLELIESDQHQQPQRFSVSDWQETCEQLPIAMNQWLEAPEFRSMLEEHYPDLGREQDIDVVLVAQSLDQLAQLPWQLWKFCQLFPRAVVSFSLQTHRAPLLEGKTRQGIRILAFFGDAQGVDIQGDLHALDKLNQLPMVEVVFAGLDQPLSRTELLELLREKQGWDILFYGGHSQTLIRQTRQSRDLAGVIHLEDEAVEFADLEGAMRQAIERGLQLALFNSCDGLGMAHLLTQLGLSASIVMSQPVTNGVAITFARYFFEEFSRGDSAYGALREARKHLQDLEHRYRCAGWLPTLFCNPVIAKPDWEAMLEGSQKLQRQRDRKVSLVTSVAALVTVLGLMAMGAFEFLDLKAYDWMLVSRPREALDDRLLIITTPEEFRGPDKEERNFFPESTLKKLLTTLEEKFEPAVVGLDFRQEESPILKEWMAKEHILAVCASKEDGIESDYDPPQNLEDQQYFLQVGWAMLFADPKDDINRRWRYQRSLEDIKEPCVSTFAFSTLVAATYLNQKDPDQDIIYKPVDPINEKDFRFESVVLKSLRQGDGGYVNSAIVGWEMLIDYRNGKADGKSGAVAKVLTLSQVLGNELSEQEIEELKGRIILVGGRGDVHSTPYDSKMLGVTLHGHLTSQLLSAIENGDPLLKGMPRWMSQAWVTLIALSTGVVLWWSHRRGFWVGFAILMVGVMGVSYGLILMGWWLPVMAPLSVLLLIVTAFWGYQMLSRSLLRSSVK